MNASKCATVILIFVSFPSSADHNVAVRWNFPLVARSGQFGIQKCFNALAEQLKTTQLLEIFCGSWSLWMAFSDRALSFEMFWLMRSLDHHEMKAEIRQQMLRTSRIHKEINFRDFADAIDVQNASLSEQTACRYAADSSCIINSTLRLMDRDANSLPSSTDQSHH